MDFSSAVTQLGDFVTGLTQKPHFWEVAFIVAVIALILAHKFTIEALVEV